MFVMQIFIFYALLHFGLVFFQLFFQERIVYRVSRREYMVWFATNYLTVEPVSGDITIRSSLKDFSAVQQYQVTSPILKEQILYYFLLTSEMCAFY